MMFSYRLVRLIESQGRSARRRTWGKSSGEPPGFALSRYIRFRIERAGIRDIPTLGRVAARKEPADIEHRYREIGSRRAQQKAPLSELGQAIVLSKENLWQFLTSGAVMDRAIEIMGELELLQMLEMFFDRAIYFAAVGYEEAVARSPRPEGALQAS